MGIPGSANPMLFGGAAAYQINQSLRFDGSAYLSRTPSSAGNRKTFTISFWMKLGQKTSTNASEVFLYAGTSPVSSWFHYNENSSTRSGAFYINQGSTSADAWTNDARFRDYGAWMHFCSVHDYTATDKWRLYINGQLIPDVTSSYALIDQNSEWNNSVLHRIGDHNTASNYAFQGYMAEFHNVDGTALDPSSFGETDTITGAWIPKKYSGSYGTNGFYLKFDPSATNGIGHDHSGNGNNFTATGFSTSGTGTDVMSDTPTNNWCTLNPLDTGGATLSDGNLNQATPSSGYGATRGTIGVSSGKWYWEVTPTSLSGGVQLGIAGVSEAFTTSTQIGALTTGYAYQNNQKKYGSGVSTSYGDSFTTSDVIGVALDLDGGTLTFYKSGTSQGTAFTGLTGTFAPALSDNSNSAASAFVYNFGQRSFSYTPPTGFKALNTANLPEPTIKKGSKYFDTKTYTGNGSTQTISGLGFQPDLVWVKSRSQTVDHLLFDAVRGFGSGKELSSDNTNQEGGMSTNLYGYVSGVGTDSFSVAAGSSGANYVNVSSQTYVAWNWDANGAGSSNTAGSITSTVSANATAGFSIVKWTGTSTAGSIGHGLGVTPNWIIHKFLSASNWSVYTTTTGLNDRLKLNSTDAETADGGVTAVSSTTFSLSAAYNDSVSDHIAYCFSEVAGYSKFGSYTGNGSSDGPFVYCGFKIAWLLMKNTGSSNWLLLDAVRGQYYNPIGYKNATKESLYANSAVSESSTGTGFQVDFLSNGFKCRASVPGELNEGGSTFIFAAFAEHPFKYANAR